MTDETTTNPALATWASDWADEFDQGWSEEALAEWVGKTVNIHTPEGVEPHRGAIATVVGYSIDTLVGDYGTVHRYSFITDQGQQVSLFAQMQVEEHSE